MYVIMNLLLHGSQIIRSWHANGLWLSIDYLYSDFKYILDDMMLIRSLPWNVGHDLDLKISF